MQENQNESDVIMKEYTFYLSERPDKARRLALKSLKHPRRSKRCILDRVAAGRDLVPRGNGFNEVNKNTK